jgi:tetratricopeptide (TPR) repeat protein
LSVQIRIDKSKLLIDLNENRKALNCLSKWLDLDKNDESKVEILYLMVFPNYKLWNYDEAIRLLKEILEHKKDLEYVNGLGELLVKTEKYQEFIDLTDKLMVEEKKSLKTMPLDIVSKYGEWLFKLNKRQQAEKWFDIILKHNIGQVSDLVRAVGQMHEQVGDVKNAMKYYLTLVNTALNCQQQDDNSDEENEPDKKPEAKLMVPMEVEFDILKCSEIYLKLQKTHEAENLLLKGLKYFNHSFKIRKQLSNIYRDRDDIQAAINITTMNTIQKTNRKTSNSDSDYNPSEPARSEDIQEQEESDEDIPKISYLGKRHSRYFSNKNTSKRQKVGEGEMDEEAINQELVKMRKTIYEDYNHGDLILKFEQSKIHFENKDHQKFTSVLVPTLNSIIKRNIDIESYASLLKLAHMQKYPQNTTASVETPSDPLDFVQHKSLYKNLESDRLKKEVKASLDNLSTELSALPSLYPTIPEPVFSDIIFKLLTEIKLTQEREILTPEFLENLMTTKVFNKYPESSKTIMWYLFLAYLLPESMGYPIRKRLWRIYPDCPIVFELFSQSVKQLPEYYYDSNGEIKVVSYRSFVDRLLKKSESDYLWALLGNSYLKTLSYEKAIEAYSNIKVHHPAVDLLKSVVYLHWCWCRTNRQKAATALKAFKFLRRWWVGAGGKVEDAYEYNLARFRQFLGMTGKAKKGYEEVIQKGGDREKRLVAYKGW